MPDPMTSDQRAFYDQHGYLVVRGLFEAAELERWTARFLAIVDGDAAAAEEMLVMRDVMVAKGAVAPASRREAIQKIQDFHHDLVLFDGYVRHERLLDWAEAFVGPDIKSVHTMLINKPPNVDGRHPLHQDILYFAFRPADRIVAAWTALERVTRASGCLVVVPGSHTQGIREHGNPDWEWLNLGYFGAKDVGPDPARHHLEMDAGDTVFFHPLLLHGSGRNRTPGFRRAISAHFASARCRFPPGTGPIGGHRPFVLVRGRAHEGGI